MPDGIVRLSSFLPPLLGLMWGPVAALGIFCGELLTDAKIWELPGIWATSGIQEACWQTFMLAYRGALWAFFAAYMPYRLWHSLLLYGPVYCCGLFI